MAPHAATEVIKVPTLKASRQGPVLAPQGQGALRTSAADPQAL